MSGVRSFVFEISFVPIFFLPVPVTRAEPENYPIEPGGHRATVKRDRELNPKNNDSRTRVQREGKRNSENCLFPFVAHLGISHRLHVYYTDVNDGSRLKLCAQTYATGLRRSLAQLTRDHTHKHMNPTVRVRVCVLYEFRISFFHRCIIRVTFLQ